MNNLLAGTYIVAVSGGVDSMSLLHMLQAQSKLKLVVAHFDHGIRTDSQLDRQLVQRQAEAYGLPFIYGEGQLGAGASEAQARQARYNFLHKVRTATNARAIITAHHQDDLLETALLNLLRGTGRRGLSSLRSREPLLRPLLEMSKAELQTYARDNQLVWREDSTNQNPVYLRNYVRRHLMPRLGKGRQMLLQHIRILHELNDQIDTELMNQLHLQPAVDQLDRHWFIMLPHSVAREVIATWLRQRGVGSYDRKTLERLVTAAKTLRSGQRSDVVTGYYLAIGKEGLALKQVDR